MARPLPLALAVVALALAVAAARASWADAAYHDGTGYTDDPSRDVPGRLDAYRTALDRAPDTFVYLLRTSQIVAARAAGGGDPALAGEALALAERAVVAHPFDPRARIALARALVLAGRSGAARDACRVALRLGPRHPSVHEAAAELGAGLWAAGGDLEALRLALDAEVARRAWLGAASVVKDGAAAVRRRGAAALGDLMEAAAGDADRLSVAAEWSRLARDDAAGALAAAAAAARRRSGDGR